MQVCAHSNCVIIICAIVGARSNLRRSSKHSKPTQAILTTARYTPRSTLTQVTAKSRVSCSCGTVNPFKLSPLWVLLRSVAPPACANPRLQTYPTVSPPTACPGGLAVRGSAKTAGRLYGVRASFSPVGAHSRTGRPGVCHDCREYGVRSLFSPVEAHQ